MTCPASQPAISPTTIHARNPMFALLGSAPGRPKCTIYPRRLAMIQLGFSAPEPFQGPRVANGLFKVEAGSLITVENRPTRTLSKPDGICSSGVGQHLVKARHANLPYNARPGEVMRSGPDVRSEEQTS